MKDLKIYQVADNRTCFRCGARAGCCEHLERDNHTITVASSPVSSGVQRAGQTTRLRPRTSALAAIPAWG